MSGLQLTVDFARALAWPIAIIVIVVLLRRPLGDILVQLASGLRRLRAGQSDAEFDRIAALMRAELTASVSAGGLSPAAIPVLLRFATAAEEDPAAAVAQAFGSVEVALRELLGFSGKLVPVGTGDPTAVARFARDQGLVPESVVRAVDGAVSLRDFAAADPARVTRNHAVKYLALVDVLLFAIVTPRERSIP
jgi:hypothetical protein